jgi:hypothetical protein
LCTSYNSKLKYNSFPKALNPLWVLRNFNG